MDDTPRQCMPTFRITDASIRVSIQPSEHRACIHTDQHNSKVDLILAWERPEDDDFFHAAIKAFIGRLKEIAIEDGLWDEELTLYPNCALWDTPAEELYGTTNAAWLKAIQNEVDPDRVMFLVGGFAL